MTPIEIKDLLTTGYAVVDEACVIPATPYKLELAYAPEDDLVFWSGLLLGGTQFDIITTGSPAQGEVLVDYASGYLTFNSADEATTVYATYTGIGTPITRHIMNYIQAEIVAAQTAIAATGTPIGCIWGGPGTAAAGTIAKVVSVSGTTPILGLAECDNTGSIPPSCMITSSTTQGSTCTPRFMGYVTGLSGLGTDGKTLYLGDDGLVSWPGQGNFPSSGETVFIVGRAITDTTMWLEINHAYTVNTDQ